MKKMLPTFDFENQCLHDRNLFSQSSREGFVVGVDEAGCGPWAGPVVAGAVIFLNRELSAELIPYMRDSKTLSPQKREFAYGLIEKYEGQELYFAHGLASVQEIDQLNIAKATFLAMKRAIAALPVLPAHALVDGIRKPDLPCPIQMIVKGDQRSFSIAAASIVAKVIRDRLMHQLDKVFPAYGWKNNAGYGTAQHQQALHDFGVTPHHRRTYAPIARLLVSTS